MTIPANQYEIMLLTRYGAVSNVMIVDSAELASVIIFAKPRLTNKIVRAVVTNDGVIVVTVELGTW